MRILAAKRTDVRCPDIRPLTMSVSVVQGLASADAEIRRLFEMSNDLLATFGRDGCFQYLNPAWEQTLGWTLDELRGRRAVDLVHEDDLHTTLALADTPDQEVVNFENRYRTRDGGYRWLLWSACPHGDVWYTVAKDVTERKELERRALQDPLTGLPNRLVLMDRLELALRRQRRSGRQIAVLFVDLDRFKVANDTLGHDVGDALLLEATRRLRDTVRDTDTVARLGGDEFVVLAEDLVSHDAALALAERIVLAFECPFRVEHEEVAISASVGLTLAPPRHDTSPDELLREADMAMYRAKAAGRDRHELFDDLARAEAVERVRVATELRQAVGRDELYLVYQPLVTVSDGAVAGCEALLRWRSPDRGEMMPGDFIPLAEDNGLIVPIGDWVLREACRQAAAWRREGRQLTVSVNVSPTQLGQASFVEDVKDAALSAGLPLHCLSVELLEASVMVDPERAVRVLSDLREMGVRISLDDFGKGATSLSYFRSLPLDVVKLDRAFVDGLESGVEDRAIVAAVVSLADEMGLSVVAEGIETEDQLAEVRKLGCGYAQGFFFARPERPEVLSFEGFEAHAQPGLGDPFVIREFMRQIGIPARIQ
jgi:diguanylate cyclase (GGDEF)-like protein/PAS domain S-box-containing protein